MVDRNMPFRRITIEQAKKEIQEYIDKHNDGSFTSEIIEALLIEPAIVIDALLELKRDGKTLDQ